MVRIGLISDTHSYLDPNVFKHFEDRDEIWHGGDIGDIKVIKDIEAFKPTKAVFGNIDDLEIRNDYPENLFFEVEGLKVLITHIGALPPTYNPRIRDLFKKYEPNLFICGHSHILRVIKDQKAVGRVYINPGAAGRQGFHSIRTIMKMDIEGGKVVDLKVVELGAR